MGCWNRDIIVVHKEPRPRQRSDLQAWFISGTPTEDHGKSWVIMEDPEVQPESGTLNHLDPGSPGLLVVQVVRTVRIMSKISCPSFGPRCMNGGQKRRLNW